MFWNKKNIVKNNKKIVIIGGGIGGLYTGIQLLLKGYDVTLIEKNNKVGGKLLYYNQYYPYIINNEKILLKLLNDVNIVLYGELFININNIVIVNNNERILIPSKLEDFHMLLNSYFSVSTNEIQDFNKIKDFIVLIKQINKGNVSKKYQRLSIEDYFLTINNERIRNILNSILPSNYSLISLLNYLNSYFNNDLKIINFDIIKLLEEKFKTLNGKLLLNKDVNNIAFTKKNHIDSLILNDSSLIKGDYFISTIDPYYLLKNILHNRYSERKFNLRYENNNIYKTDNKIIISFNINKPIENDIININCKQLKINTTSLLTLSFYKSINKNIVYCVLPQNNNDYEMYRIIYDNKKMLTEINNKIIALVKNEFNKHFPEYLITFNNIVTPIDINSQFNSYNGALKGFIPSPINNIIVNEEIFGLDNLFNCSSWLSSTGGILNAMLVSRECVNRLEKRIKNE